jgi:hypothetical protein
MPKDQEAGVYEGTPAEERKDSDPSEAGVYKGTPNEEQPGGDYGPLGWADVPGRPEPPVGKGTQK